MRKEFSDFEFHSGSNLGWVLLNRIVLVPILLFPSIIYLDSVLVVVSNVLLVLVFFILSLIFNVFRVKVSNKEINKKFEFRDIEKAFQFDEISLVTFVEGSKGVKPNFKLKTKNNGKIRIYMFVGDDVLELLNFFKQKGLKINFSPKSCRTQFDFENQKQESKGMD